MIKPILQLGDPLLYKNSLPIKQEECATLEDILIDLHETMMNFREKYKRGRAISAPQIDVLKRLIYINMNDTPLVLINPEFTWKSPEMIELWDDCMSFPDLLVKVKRHKDCALSFYDLDWNKHSLELEGEMSELIQHEYDHLDGILATNKAIDDQSLALASQKQYTTFSR